MYASVSTEEQHARASLSAEGHARARLVQQQIAAFLWKEIGVQTQFLSALPAAADSWCVRWAKILVTIFI